MAFRALNFEVKPELQLPLTRNIAAAIESSVRSWKINTRAAQEKRIRLGYLSPDFREHAVGFLTQSLFGLHDRDRFEVFGYALTSDELSPTRSTIKSGCDQFRDVSRLTAREAAERIAADGIDILVDLGGYTAHTRSEIVAARPAPLAVSYLGYLGTMGADFIDYLIADRIVVPHQEEAFYHERLALLPRTFWVYGKTREVPPTPYPRTSLGLPEKGMVFCVSHAAYKISPETFDLWMRILRRAKGSVLWLIAREPRVKDNLRREAGQRGISADRLIFSPGAPHSINMSRLQLADLYLDAPHYNAGATGLDALWAGLPLLTYPTRGMVGRMAASALQALDCPELIAGSLQEYEDKAVGYAEQPDSLAALRDRLARARTRAALFDTGTRVRELEAAYAHMVERQRSGLPPATFEVPFRLPV
jgi:protein O-GlcNAc transferase